MKGIRYRALLGLLSNEIISYTHYETPCMYFIGVQAKGQGNLNKRICRQEGIEGRSSTSHL